MLILFDLYFLFLLVCDYEDMQIQICGSFGGLGIEVGQEDGLVKVILFIDDILVVEVGVKFGDFIIYVNGELLMGLNFDEVVEKMCGLVGLEIKIIILCQGENEFFDLIMICDIIKLIVVKICIEGYVVVLCVLIFNDEIMLMLKFELEKGIKDVGGIDKVNGFVLDLCNNFGGLFNQVIEVLDVFFDKGEIVLICGCKFEELECWNVQVGDLVQGKFMVVLINGGLVLVLEIVGGVLQDYCCVIVVGMKFFGKGLVQIVMLVILDSVIWLIIVWYYIFLGCLIQLLGIQFDIIVE